MITKNTDFPQIVVNSIPAPELIYDKISDEELRPYIQGLEELDSLRLDFILMVCNTIHLYYLTLQQTIKTPILNLREELKNVLIDKNITSAMIVGTPSTIKQGLYKFNGIKLFEPNENEMNQLTNAIFNFNKGLNKQEQIKKVKKICRKYLNEGAQIVILGCTEFAVMLKDEKLPKINTIDVLVEATINKSILIKQNIIKKPL